MSAIATTYANCSDTPAGISEANIARLRELDEQVHITGFKAVPTRSATGEVRETPPAVLFVVEKWCPNPDDSDKYEAPLLLP